MALNNDQTILTYLEKQNVIVTNKVITTTQLMGKTTHTRCVRINNITHIDHENTDSCAYVNIFTTDPRHPFIQIPLNLSSCTQDDTMNIYRFLLQKIRQ